MKRIAKKLSLITAVLLVLQMASIGLGVGVNGALAAEGAPEITNLTLVKVGTTGTATDIGTITNGMAINMANPTTGESLNIRANTTPSVVTKVSFSSNKVIDNEGNHFTRDEVTAPYMSAGDNSTTGKYNSWKPSLGEYRLTVTPYVGTGANEVAGSQYKVTFTVYNDPTSPEVKTISINSTKLMNGDSYIINKADAVGHPTIKINVEYSKDMNTTVKPVLASTPDIKSTVACDTGTWLFGDRNIEYTCTLNDVNVEIPVVDVNISGGKDLAGNLQEVYSSITNLNASLGVDTKAPSLNFDPVSGKVLKNQPIAVTATVTEDTKAPLQETDFVVTNGDISDFVPNLNVYKFSVTPKAEGNITITVPSGSYQDLAGNQNAEDVNTITYDATAPAAVSGLTVGTNPSGYPVISWTNPPAGTYAGLKVLRDGAFLVTLDPSATRFTDLSAARGTTYTYEVVAFDSAGNETTVAPVVVTTPPATPVVVHTSYKIASAAISDSEPQISQATTSNPSNQGVKANENKNTDTKDDSNSLPTWGIIFLFILAGIGGYLVYTQKPKPVTGPSNKVAPKPKAPKTTRKK